jgi:hypothetical protein
MGANFFTFNWAKTCSMLAKAKEIGRLQKQYNNQEKK